MDTAGLSYLLNCSTSSTTVNQCTSRAGAREVVPPVATSTVVLTVAAVRDKWKSYQVNKYKEATIYNGPAEQPNGPVLADAHHRKSPRY